ncbi:MAG: pilin [Burkholderiales bacterium]
MMRSQRGFGLGLGTSYFETLVMPALILTVLALVAIPAWLDHKARERITGGLAQAAKAQAAVERAFMTKGPGDFSQAPVSGWTPPKPGEFVESIRISRTGIITVRYTAKVATAEENELQIVPMADGKPLDLSNPASKGRKFSWQCGGGAGNTTVRESRRPETCR